jgi:hypothetical protein
MPVDAAKQAAKAAPKCLRYFLPQEAGRIASLVPREGASMRTRSAGVILLIQMRSLAAQPGPPRPMQRR